MAKDYDKIAASLGGNLDSLAAASGGAEMVTVKEHQRKRPSQDWRRAGAQTGAGLLGDVAGGPIGAGVAGAGAEAATQAAEQGVGIGPMSIGGVYDPAAVLEAGNIQMGSSLVGRGIAKGVQGIGQAAMQLAVRMTPEAAQTALREGIVATKHGWRRLDKRAAELAGTEMRIVREAAGKGRGWVDPVEFIRPVFNEIAEKVQGGGRTARSEASKLMDKFLEDHPHEKLSPALVLKIRRFSDIESAAAKKFGAQATSSVKKLWDNALSNRARQVLRAEVPEIADPAVYEKLTGKATTPAQLQQVKDALRTVLKRGRTVGEQVGKPALAYGTRGAVGAAVGGAIPGDRAAHAWEGAVLGAALLHPAVLSHLALAAQNPALAQILTQAPRVGVGAYQAMSE